MTRLFKTAIVAALIGVAGAASIAPASAHDNDRHGGYSRDRDNDRGGRHDHRWHHHRHHFHRGWF
ncbi:MAG: hypothetical protein WDM86_13100 [Rhizomicrobium sp.]